MCDAWSALASRGLAAKMAVWSRPRIRKNSPGERIASVCKSLSRLILEVPRLRDLLDLVVGVVASLVRARDLGYQDRFDPLSDDYSGGSRAVEVRGVISGEQRDNEPWPERVGRSPVPDYLVRLTTLIFLSRESRVR